MCGRIRQARGLREYEGHLRWNPRVRRSIWLTACATTGALVVTGGVLLGAATVGAARYFGYSAYKRSGGRRAGSGWKPPRAFRIASIHIGTFPPDVDTYRAWRDQPTRTQAGW